MLICGVDSQECVVLGKIFREYASKIGFIKKVVGTESRGLYQRKGSFATTARYLFESKNYYLDQNYRYEDLVSPFIPANDAHLVIGMEPLETLRNLRYISEKTEVILNTHNYFPIKGSTLGNDPKIYPSNALIIDHLDQFARRVVALNFNELSSRMYTSSIYTSVITLGVAIRDFDEFFNLQIFKNIIKNTFKDDKKYLEALELGYNLINNEF